MSKLTCVISPCPEVPTLVRDPETSLPLVCRTHYQQWWRDRKRNGEGAIALRHIDVECRCGCGTPISLTGARRRTFEEKGKLPYASRECQKRDSTVEVECAGCAKSIEMYRSYVERNNTGRFVCPGCRAAGVGCKPRRGEERQCQGCPEKFYVKPGDTTSRFHDRDCRTKYEQEHLQVELVCALDGCGVAFKVWKSHADRGRKYHSQECRTIGMITNVAPGPWHNGRPKRHDSDGYILIYEPEHPNATRYGWVFEHRWVVEQAVGDYLSSVDEVDHINEIKDDNRLENLRVLTKKAHASVTGKSVWRKRAARDAALAAELEEYRRRFGALESAT